MSDAGVSPFNEVLALYTGPRSNTALGIRMLFEDLVEWAEGVDPGSAEFDALMDALYSASKAIAARAGRATPTPMKKPPLRIL